MNKNEWYGEESDRIDKQVEEENEKFYKALFEQKGITKEKFLSLDVGSQEYYMSIIK